MKLNYLLHPPQPLASVATKSRLSPSWRASLLLPLLVLLGLTPLAAQPTWSVVPIRFANNTTVTSTIGPLRYRTGTTISAIASNRLFQSSDFGLTWTDVRALPISARDVDFWDANSGFVVSEGTNGFARHTSNNFAASISPSSSTTVIPNAIALSSPTSAYTCNNGGGITFLNASSGTAIAIFNRSSSTTQELLDIDVFDTSVGIAVGFGGAIVRTANLNATNWPAVTSGTTQTLRGVDIVSIDFLNSNIGTAYAVGDNGTILKSTTGGTSWTALTSGTTENLFDVDFIDANNGYVVGANGLILNTTDGGATWTQTLIPFLQMNTRTLVRVLMLNTTNVHISGTQGFYARYGCTTTGPTITTQPTTTSVCAGATANFSVVATSGSPITYQWRRNGGNIAGATSASLAVSNVTASEAGTYSVVVTDECGSTTSADVFLTLRTATSITTQPNPSQTVCANTTASFSVTGAGTSPITYQWRKDGTNITGANASSYTLLSATTANSGVYSVVVTGACGSVTSNNASLTVNPATTISTQPTNTSGCIGGAASFTVTATGTGTLTYQWRKNGTNISGATSATLNFPIIVAGDAATYTVVVGSTCGSATSAGATLSISTATSITTQPSNVTVCPGAAANFSVVGSGTGTLSYQWRKDGTNIAGATSASLSLPSAAAGDVGAYSVVVTGSCGSVTSSNATLTVNPATTITTQPVNTTACSGSNTSLTVAGTGTGAVSYQWRKNGNLITGATSASFIFNGVSVAEAGTYSVVVTSSCGSVTSNDAVLTVNPLTQITSLSSSMTTCAGSSASFTVAAVASGALSYQWRKDGTNITGATSATLSFPVAAVADAGNYSVVVTGGCGSVTSSSVSLTVVPSASITTQPVNTSACEGAAASFSVVASGASTYQWRLNGSNIVGANSATYNIPSASAGAAGNYSVVVSGGCGSVTSSAATLTVNSATTITTQPTNASACVGSPSSFTVVGAGSGALSYQWRRNGTNIAGASSATLSFVGITAGDAGTYSVVVTGSCGSVTSSNATLTLNVPTVVTSQPVNATVCQGATANFNVNANGTGTLGYQWQKNGLNIPGATNATLSLTGVTSANAGMYSVIVVGGCGNVVSNNATLTVNPATAITTQPAAQTVNSGQPVSFSVVAVGTGTLSYQWLKNGSAISGASSATYSIPAVAAADAGTYSVIVTASCGNVTSSNAMLTVNVSTSLEQTLAAAGLDFFPNPVGDVLTLTGPDVLERDMSITLQTQQGVSVIHRSYSKGGYFGTQRYSVDALASGLYFLVVGTDVTRTVVRVLKR